MLDTHALQQTQTLIREVGLYILNQSDRVRQKDIKTKALNSLVTYVDQEAERQLVMGLRDILPDAGFLVEEETVQTTAKDQRWIIDPLDGTTNFLHGVPAYAVSVALETNGKIQLGIVYDIPHDQLFFAQLGQGASKNGKALQVSQNPRLADSLIATGFPYTTFKHQDNYLQFFAHLMPRCRGLRRLGSAAIDLAYTAEGIFQGFYESGLHPWDVAAGALIVREAGGQVTDYRGGHHFIENQEILAASPSLHAQLQREISQFL
jgi:myo-inositol-1(or 4)-monophosphatase